MFRRFIPAVLLLVCLAAGSAHAARLGPLLQDIQKAIDKNDAGQLCYEELIAMEATDKVNDPRLGVIMYLGEDTPSFAGVPGLVLGSVTGEIATARLPLSSLDELTAVEGVVYIRAARLLKPLLDQAVDAAGVRPVWTGTSAYTGYGVLVGIIDSGIDWAHDDFQTAAGQTRILSIWDMYGAGTPPSGYGEGALYTQTQINSGMVPERDYSGHGTHVAGIAAGNGRASSGDYRGAAFGADLLITKPYSDEQGGFPEDFTIDAMKYLAQQAQVLGRPLVINMSLGGHSGAHDGTDAQEILIDQLSGPGVIFCIAAGNEAEDGVHTQWSGDGGRVLNIPAYTSSPDPRDDYLAMELWIDGQSSPDIFLSIGGNSYGPFRAGERSELNSTSGYLFVDNAYGGPTPINSDKLIYIYMAGQPSASLAAGDWTITLSGGQGEAHSWIYSQSIPASFSGVDASYTVAVPGTAAQAITVAAWKSRNQWTSIEGPVGYSGTWGAVELGAIAPFSSQGPARDGSQKPDICAPGMAVISCLSADATLEDHDLLIVSGQRYWANQGTSMAAPLVAGTVALMLEKDPTLTPALVKAALTGTAVTDGYTGAVWNAAYGYGKLDAHAALAAISGSPVDRDGDLDGDGQTTSADVDLLTAYVLDPVNSLLNASVTAHADVYPDGAPDGQLNIFDVARMIAFVAGEDPQPPFPAYGQKASLVLSGPDYLDGWWWIEATLSGAGVGGCQFALYVNGADWSPAAAELAGAGSARIEAAEVGDRLRVLLHHPDNLLPTAGVTLRLPFQRAAGAAGEMRIEGLLVADDQGQVRSVETNDNLAATVDALGVWPNPAPGAARVHVSLSRPEIIDLRIFDLRGRLIRTLPTGDTATQNTFVDWNGRDDQGRLAPAGVYLVRLLSPSLTLHAKCVLYR